MAYRIEVDPDVCMSSGKCVAEAPGLFRFNDDEIAEVIPGGEQQPDEKLVSLAQGCPAGALRVFRGEAEVDIY